MFWFLATEVARGMAGTLQTYSSGVPLVSQAP